MVLAAHQLRCSSTEIERPASRVARRDWVACPLAKCGEGSNMNILQWLNKLGILRWGGTVAVYHNAKERPIELQQPGVFNAERDLVGRRDATVAKPAPRETLPTRKT